MTMSRSEIMFWKRAFHSNLHIYAHIHIFEKLFTKLQYLNLALALQAHFLEWRLTHFGKELFKYIYTP